MPTASNSASMTWLYFSLITVVAWGVYGVLLSRGRAGMGMSDPDGLFKAFLFVGVAYFICGVIAPVAVLLMHKASFTMPSAGVTWSLLAGVAGAMGAFNILLAFTNKGSPAVVMSIVFGGAPVVNALLVIWLMQAWKQTPWQFWVGLLLVATGGAAVTLYKPNPHAAHKPAAAATAPAASAAAPSPDNAS